MIINKCDLKRGIVSDIYKIDLETILNEVSIFTGISIQEMESKYRKRELTDARSIYLYFSYLYANYSGPTIAGFIYKHHTSVVYARTKCNYVIKNDFKDFKDFMNHKYILNKIDREHQFPNKYEKI